MKFYAGLLSLLLLLPASAFAGLEATGVIGGLVGGDLTGIVSGNFSLTRSFSNAPLYGVRLGYSLPFIVIEGSLVGSPNGLNLDLEDTPVSVDTKVYYLEANILFTPLPGMISPFVTAGIGRHYFDFDIAIRDLGSGTASFNKNGYNYGGGLKVNFSRVVVRGEIRDHVTEIGPADFGLEEIAEELGFNFNETLHNVEISFGVGIRF
jgi:opacity protein-like surface antigen